jgi:conjugative transfer signal peptidase TraF
MAERYASCPAAQLERDGATERSTVLRIVILCALPMLPLLATMIWHPRQLLLWNASPSSPRGLYAVIRERSPRTGDTIIAWAPQAARRLADRRHYLPASVPLVKPVAAVAGDRVCATGAAIRVNGRTAANRRRSDPSGRRLPWWNGCRRLRPGEVLLLSPRSPLAFDGRYFGVTRASEIIGKGWLLWAG